MKKNIRIAWTITLISILVIFLLVTFYPKDLEYTIIDCNEVDDNHINPNNKYLNLTVEENSIVFDSIQSRSCSTPIILEYERNGNELKIIERYGTQNLAMCVCPTGISGRINNLEKGVYTVRFVFSRSEIMKKESLIGEEVVEIK